MSFPWEEADIVVTDALGEAIGSIDMGRPFRSVSTDVDACVAVWCFRRFLLWATYANWSHLRRDFSYASR